MSEDFEHDFWNGMWELLRDLRELDTRDLGPRAAELKEFIVGFDQRHGEVIKAVRKREYDGEIAPEDITEVLREETRRLMDSERDALAEAAEELADIMGAGV